MAMHIVMTMMADDNDDDYYCYFVPGIGTGRSLLSRRGMPSKEPSDRNTSSISTLQVDDDNTL